MIPCVVLASVPRTDVEPREWEYFEKEYYDFRPGTIRSSPYEVSLKRYGSQDGGNGGGGEPGGTPMRPSLGRFERVFWDFKHHAEGLGYDDKFPIALRHELCLSFKDIGYAASFLSRHPAGIRLGRLFTFVQIVALSTPTFVGSSLDPNLSDAFNAPGHSIGG